MYYYQIVVAYRHDRGLDTSAPATSFPTTSTPSGRHFGPSQRTLRSLAKKKKGYAQCALDFMTFGLGVSRPIGTSKI